VIHDNSRVTIFFSCTLRLANPRSRGWLRTPPARTSPRWAYDPYGARLGQPQHDERWGFVGEAGTTIEIFYEQIDEHTGQRLTLTNLRHRKLGIGLWICSTNEYPAFR